MKISKNSWHYRWISNLESGYKSSDLKLESFLDSCAYTRKLIGAFVKTIIMIGAACLVTAVVGDFLAWVTVATFTGMVEPKILTLIFFGFLIATIMILCWMVGETFIRFLSNRSKKITHEQSEPCLLFELVKLYKDKICVKIDVVE